MATWTLIFVAYAGVMIIAHTLVVMWYVRTCYRVWKQSDSAIGFLQIAGRSVLGTVVYGLIALALGVPFIGLITMLGLSPELASNLAVPVDLAARAASATFLLPLMATSGNWLLAPFLVLVVFFLLGLMTMLPGLGYGSKVIWGKVIWGSVGLTGYAAYLFIAIATSGNMYAGLALIAASILIAGAAMWLGLKAWSALRPKATLPETG